MADRKGKKRKKESYFKGKKIQRGKESSSVGGV